jgi:signal transduction histidine kinase
MENNSVNKAVDPRLENYLLAVEKIKNGNYRINLALNPVDELGCLGQGISEMAEILEQRYMEQERLEKVIFSINSGLMLEDILENIYRDFREILPYNRIGLALLENEGRRVTAVWGKSDQPDMKIERGYSASLSGSSLEKILQTGRPRVINDLIQYLKTKPQSESTQRIVAEGMRSSLTCPLIANGESIGFLFFSSVHPDTYSRVHIEIFRRIAQQISLSVEKGRLVSDLASSKSAIEAQNEDLRRLNEIKNTFLGVAAHDLRSPLSQIQLATTLLLEPEPWLSEEERNSLLRSFLGNIEKHTRHMLDLLNDLLDASQIEAGDLNLKFESVAMKVFLEEVVQNHTLLAANKGIKLVLSEVFDDQLVADPHRLRQVLDNLITNALRFSPPGTTVSVSGKLAENKWILTVEDDGPGIKKKEKDMFFRDLMPVSKQDEVGTKNSGLELAIARRVIEAHGGEIGVDSRHGKGARFWLSLPY